MDDVLIPRIAPTYIEEFQRIIKGKKPLAYFLYHKENYEAFVTPNSSQFSLKNMFGSLKCRNFVSFIISFIKILFGSVLMFQRETGKSVIDPQNANYTWLHYPPVLVNGLEKYEVEENVITHLKTINWVSF